MPRSEVHDRLIMGVLNITPDSFSDGGLYLDKSKAFDKAMLMLDQGADIIDLGAESTKPGAEPVSTDEEWRRLSGPLELLCGKGLAKCISVDTRNQETALKVARTFEVAWINNVAGVFPPDVMTALAKVPGLNYIAMHMHGEPATMQHKPLKGKDAVDVLRRQFETFRGILRDAGFASERIYFDPGIGFGKDDAANIQLLAETGSLACDFQLCLGVSRKSFLGRILGLDDVKQRDAASKMLEFGLWFAGARIIRTHDVESLARIRKLWQT